MPEWTMDRWKFFDITHRNHVLCNPTSLEKLDEVCSLTDLKPGDRVLDIACGKAEVLVRLAERYNIRGVGVDISPYCIQDARRKHMSRASGADLEFIEKDGADYTPDEPQSFELAICLGASWVYGGHRGTLRAMRDMAKPQGLVMVGEPCWIRKPDPEYLADNGFTEDTFGTHHDNARVGEEEGMELVYTVVSSKQDFDRYEALQWHAASQYARDNPEDPDLPEFMERVRSFKESYLRWGRDTLGWAMYLFRKIS